jgi:hypothetical protein
MSRNGYAHICGAEIIFDDQSDFVRLKVFIQRHNLPNRFMQVCNWNALLLHAVAVTNGYAVVFQRFVIYRYANRRSNSVLSSVSATNGVFVVVL